METKMISRDFLTTALRHTCTQNLFLAPSTFEINRLYKGLRKSWNRHRFLDNNYSWQCRICSCKGSSRSTAMVQRSTRKLWASCTTLIEGLVSLWAGEVCELVERKTQRNSKYSKDSHQGLKESHIINVQCALCARMSFMSMRVRNAIYIFVMNIIKLYFVPIRRKIVLWT